MRGSWDHNSIYFIYKYAHGYKKKLKYSSKEYKSKK